MTIMNRVLLSWLVFTIIGLAGCGPLIHQVNVNGYTDPAAPAAIAPGGGFFVIENQKAQNPLLEKEIKEKINNLLMMQGYQLVPYDRAQYYLFFGCGIGQERSVEVVMPDYSYGFGVGTGSGWRHGSYFFAAPFFSFYPRPDPLYDRWLLLNVVDGKYYREKGEFRTIWVGEARSTGTSGDLRVAVNYLLLADFQQFGRNTGKAVSVDINAQDPRLGELTR